MTDDETIKRLRAIAAIEAELIRASGTVDHPFTLQIHPSGGIQINNTALVGENVICLVLHPDLVLRELKYLPRGTSTEEIWDLL